MDNESGESRTVGETQKLPLKRQHDEGRDKPPKRLRMKEEGARREPASDDDLSELEYVEPGRIELPNDANISGRRPGQPGPQRHRRERDGKPLISSRPVRLAPRNDRFTVAARLPPARDLGIYSHGLAVSRSYYQGVLRELGISKDIAYRIRKELFDRPPSPDSVPFLADRGEYEFKSGGFLLPPGSGVLIRTNRDRQTGKWVYSEMDSYTFSRATDAEKRLLGAGLAEMSLQEYQKFRDENGATDVFQLEFDKLRSADQLSLIERRHDRIVTKYSIMEFFAQRKTRSDRFRGKKSEAFFNRTYSELSLDDKNVLLNDSRDRYPANKIIIDSRNSANGKLIAMSILSHMGYPETLIDKPERQGGRSYGMPLLIRKDGELYKNGHVTLQPKSNLCLLVEWSENVDPVFMRMDVSQSGKVTEATRKRLGYVPSWTRTLPPLEQYQLGLLPKDSLAYRQILADNPVMRKPLDENVKSDRGGSPAAAARSPRGQSGSEKSALEPSRQSAGPDPALNGANEEDYIGDDEEWHELYKAFEEAAQEKSLSEAGARHEVKCPERDRSQERARAHSRSA